MFKYIDILKFIFSLCILCIHAGVLRGTDVYAWVDPLLYRLGVPFFFVASGFFFGRNIYNGNLLSDTNGRKRLFSRLFTKLLVFEPLNILLQIMLFLYATKTVGYIILAVGRSVLFYPWGALWYIQALLVAYWILFFFIKRGWECRALIIGLVGYAFALLCNRYYFLVEGSVVEPFVKNYLHICVSARNGVFYGLLFVTMGLLIAKYWERIKSKELAAWGCLILGFIGLTVEVACLQGRTGIDDNALYVMAIIVIPALFVAAARSEAKRIGETKTIRNLSTSIYLLHSPLLVVVGGSYKLLRGMEMNTFLLAGTTLCILLLFCAIIYKVKFRPVYDWIR